LNGIQSMNAEQDTPEVLQQAAVSVAAHLNMG
jgi:hypothetical protein